MVNQQTSATKSIQSRSIKWVLMGIALSLLTLAYAGWLKFKENAPDHYYSLVVNVEVDGTPVTLIAEYACKMFTNHYPGGGATGYARRDPETVGIRLSDGRGLYVVATNACMWPEFRRRYIANNRDKVVGTAWLDKPELDGVVPLYLADSFEHPERGEYYAYETGYSSPSSHIKYISGTIRQSSKARYVRWLSAAQNNPEQYNLQRGYIFWSFNPEQVMERDERERYRLRREGKPYLERFPNMSCFSLVKVPKDYLSAPANDIWPEIVKARVELREWMSDPTNNFKIVPTALSQSAAAAPADWGQFWFDHNQINYGQYGIYPYGKNNFSDLYFNLSFDQQKKTLTLNDGDIGLLQCTLPTNNKSYQGYTYSLHIGDHAYQAKWQDYILIYPDIFRLEISGFQLN